MPSHLVGWLGLWLGALPLVHLQMVIDPFLRLHPHLPLLMVEIAWVAYVDTEYYKGQEQMSQDKLRTTGC